MILTNDTLRRDLKIPIIKENHDNSVKDIATDESIQITLLPTSWKRYSEKIQEEEIDSTESTKLIFYN